MLRTLMTVDTLLLDLVLLHVHVCVCYLYISSAYAFHIECHTGTIPVIGVSRNAGPLPMCGSDIVPVRDAP